MRGEAWLDTANGEVRAQLCTGDNKAELWPHQSDVVMTRAPLLEHQVPMAALEAGIEQAACMKKLKHDVCMISVFFNP